uniref:Uncharacterized protein n=1 Tax=Tetranychus urticae TaxID=32264 RepID=T1K2P3_TETUR
MVAIKTNCHPSIYQLIKVFSFEVFQTKMDNSQYLNTILDHVERFYRYAHQLILLMIVLCLYQTSYPLWDSYCLCFTIPMPKLTSYPLGMKMASLTHRLILVWFTKLTILAFMIKRGTRLSTNQLDGSLWSLELFNIQGNQIIGDGIIPDQSRVLPTWKIGINGPVYELAFMITLMIAIKNEVFVCKCSLIQYRTLRS